MPCNLLETWPWLILQIICERKVESQHCVRLDGNNIMKAICIINCAISVNLLFQDDLKRTSIRFLAFKETDRSDCYGYFGCLMDVSKRPEGLFCNISSDPAFCRFAGEGFRLFPWLCHIQPGNPLVFVNYSTYY